MTDFLNPPIRADVPPSMHPDIVSPYADVLDVQGSIGYGASTTARLAFAAMYKFYSDVVDTEAALQSAARPAAISAGRVVGDVRAEEGGLRRLHGREAELAQAVDRAFANAAGVVDQHMATLKKLREELDKKVADAIDYDLRRTPEGLAVAQEVRKHLKGMKPADRLPFLAKAVEAGDKQTISAALSAPAYLSGLDAETAGTLRQIAADRWAKLEGGQLAAIDKIITQLMKSGAECMDRNLKVQRRKETPAAAADRRLQELAAS